MFLLLEVVLDSNLLIAYLAILVMAVVPIWIGSHLSLSSKATESLSTADAYKFPLVGSSVLFGFYLLFKILNKDYINMLLSLYFLAFGIGAMTVTFKPIFSFLKTKDTKLWKKSFPIPGFSDPLELEFDVTDICGFIVGCILGAWYFTTKHWIANNIIGLAFCIQGIAFFSLGSYKNGLILLTGLFFYDIFWVFGTEVMVSVAKDFDAPVKLLFPRDLFAEKLQYSMLGLGDIVIPGFFLALLLRFDKHLSTTTKKPFVKSYFLTSYFFYFVGLFTTVFVMHTFQAAQVLLPLFRHLILQPALLYLVPACIGSSFLPALFKGQVGALFAYKDEEHKPAEPPKDKTH